MKRYYAIKAVQNAKGQWVPKSRLILAAGVDYDPANGEYLTLLAPPQDPDTGALLANYYFVIAELRDHSKLLADADCSALPDFPADGKWGAINLAVRTAIKNRLKSAFGFSDAEITAIDAKDGYREVLNAVIAKLQPAVTIDNLEANVTPG